MWVNIDNSMKLRYYKLIAGSEIRTFSLVSSTLPSKSVGSLKNTSISDRMNVNTIENFQDSIQLKKKPSKMVSIEYSVNFEKEKKIANLSLNLSWSNNCFAIFEKLLLKIICVK